MTTQPTLTPEHILQTGLAFWASRTLLSAVEMGVFTELAHGPQEFESLSVRLGLHPRSSRDFLDALVALGFLSRSVATYSNTPETDLFLDRYKPTYIGGVLEMASARLFGHWRHLTEALRTGKPQAESRDETGASPFDALYADPARLKTFLAAMSGISRGANMAIARQVPWSRYKTFADRNCPGRSRRSDRARQSPSQRRRLRSARGRAHFRGIRGISRPLRPRPFSAGRLLHPGTAPRRRSHDGPHSPRLESRREKNADLESLRRAEPRRRARRLRFPH